MIRRALTAAALALCALAAVAAEPARLNDAPMSRVEPEPGRDVLAADSLALSSHATTVASALDIPPIWIEALPPPPTVVVRQTKMYGTVTFDHAAHLQRRVSCRECHGPGPVKKVVYTPRTGHDRCRGCHAMAERGPTNCIGCHTIPKPTELLAAATPVTAVAAPAGPTRLEMLAAIVPERSAATFGRSFELGVTTLASHGEVLYGPTVHLVGHYGDDLLTYTLSMPGGPTRGRTQLLVAGGREFGLSRKVRWSALGVGGLDATYDPGSVLPSAGVRLGLELAAAPWHGPVRTFSLQMTVLANLAGSAQAERRAGDVSVGLALTAGMPLSAR